MNSSLPELVEAATPKAVELRRLLHRHPEPSNQEHQTTALISTALESHGLIHQLRTPRTGLWIDVGGEPRVGFRADLDALPIHEPPGNAPRSQNPGWMHACGHDAHAAIGFGIALTLSQLDLDAGVRILFQPAEEANPGGASEFVAEGLVDGLKGLLAFHVDPTLQPNRIGSKVGPVTGSADSLRIVLSGPGGHTSRPHKTVDLVSAAAMVVKELPEAVRRALDSRIPIVTVFGSIRGGSAANVIPTEVELTGTVRTLDRSTWEDLPGLVESVLGSISAISGAHFELDYRQGIPPVVNDAGVVDAATWAIADALGPDTIVAVETSMGGEDFASYLDTVPGALLRLGSHSGGGDLHSSSFRINDASIGTGILAGTAAVVGMLERL
ncbi:MAG: amidohydrolase [Acidimicrobiia bacterium]|nr:amidohydrolase [Acidimicrobiia bacterium]